MFPVGSRLFSVLGVLLDSGISFVSFSSNCRPNLWIREVLSPVAVFDATRAAALDGVTKGGSLFLFLMLCMLHIEPHVLSHYQTITMTINIYQQSTCHSVNDSSCLELDDHRSQHLGPSPPRHPCRKGTFDWLLLLFAPKSMEARPTGTGGKDGKDEVPKEKFHWIRMAELHENFEMVLPEVLLDVSTNLPSH